MNLFNRMAEEWRRANPRARNGRRARELMEILQSSLLGVDVNPTACRITAFSLYLAYLDQLLPRDIQELQKRGRALPHLVRHAEADEGEASAGTIVHGDFFQQDVSFHKRADLVIGNPPWGDLAKEGSPAAKWCADHKCQIPNNQIATAFMWKAAHHVSDSGRVCFVLPHGVLFNHGPTALAFQKAFVSQHALDRVLNLTDYQKFLFEGAKHPALIISYRATEPPKGHATEYWAPKADWKAAKTEVIEIAKHDRTTLPMESILRDLDGEDAPQIWKRMAWASSRDHRLLDRLAALARLREHVRQPREPRSNKPWLIAEGFQPFGKNDPPSTKRRLQLPSIRFVPAASMHLNLFLLPDDCTELDSDIIDARRTIRDTRIFRAPHVLVAQGFGSVAFADFDVSFQHALRGITGPRPDRGLLMFLAAYMRSALAQYFLFHTSSNWGVSRRKVHVEELLRLPFPTPDAMCNPRRAKKIVDDVSRIVLSASRDAQALRTDRKGLVNGAQARIEPLIFEYFDILPSEQILIEDAVRVTIPSFRPNPNRRSVPAIESSSTEQRRSYTTGLCDTLNGWARRQESRVVESVTASAALGIGCVLLEKTDARASEPSPAANGDVLTALDTLRQAASLRMNTFELARGVKVFDGDRLYIVKPLSRRYWTETAALNDADEIAGSILMHGTGENA